jgi:polyphosphate kinase
MPRAEPVFFNRELSWLAFNERILEEVADTDVPLLDRLNFLSITASNLDEFFMVRVGGLRMLLKQGIRKRDASGLTPAQQIERIAARTRRMVDNQYRLYRDILQPELACAGIRPLYPEQITWDQHQALQRHFDDVVYPVISPIAVDTADPLPHLVNLRLHLLVSLRGPASEPSVRQYALIPIGPSLERFVALPAPSGYLYMPIENVITLHADAVFPGRQILDIVPFRVTRNADVAVREDQAADFMAEMENVLAERQRSDCVRLEIGDKASRPIVSFLVRKLGVDPLHLFEIAGPLDLGAFRRLAGLQGFEGFCYPAWPPQDSPAVDPRRPLFETLQQRDILLYHPYESFDPVVRFIAEAARDPGVLAIKQTLYRVSPDSPVIAALQTAAERGKSVTVIVELRARFDEERNIEWARELEDAGAQVIYGVKGLKIHSKVCLVVRREPKGIVRYMHFGTGNYNERTARIYSDVSYMTRDPALGADASAFFNMITGRSEPQASAKLAAAPIGLRDALLTLIENEIEHARQGRRALIRAKMNSLVCRHVIKALYRASRAGVRIELNVRGICCLAPGVPGLSETITVVSIVDRFLEHARIFHFLNGGSDKVFISSADWMPRNLDRRFELMVPVDDPACRKRLLRLLDVSFQDTVKARVLQPGGAYVRRKAEGRRKVRSQKLLWELAREAAREAPGVRAGTFEPYRSAKPSGV